MLTDFRCYVSLQEALSKHSHLDWVEVVLEIGKINRKAFFPSEEPET